MICEEKKFLLVILALVVMISFSKGMSVSVAILQSAPENIMCENNG